MQADMNRELENRFLLIKKKQYRKISSLALDFINFSLTVVFFKGKTDVGDSVPSCKNNKYKNLSSSAKSPIQISLIFRDQSCQINVLF